jgi:hypothetical protein
MPGIVEVMGFQSRLAMVVLAGSAISPHALADRIFSIPIGRALPLGTLKLEMAASGNSRISRDRYVAFTPIPKLEIETRSRQRAGESGDWTYDFSYNFLPPVPGLAPGISIGMLDTLGNTLDGKRAFIAITFREQLEVGQVGEYGDVTIGYQTGKLTSPFVGATLPFSGTTRLLFEHNGARVTVGLQERLYRGLTLRVFTQDNATFGGLVYQRKFKT